MIFPFNKVIDWFKRKKRRRKKVKDVDFLLIVTYFHKYANGISQEESEKIADNYRKRLTYWKEILPSNILLLDMPIMVRDETDIEIYFFPLKNPNHEIPLEIQKTVATLKKVLKYQVDSTEINNPVDFFEYEKE